MQDEVRTASAAGGSLTSMFSMEATGTDTRCHAAEGADHWKMFRSLFSDGCSPKVSDQDLYRSIQGVLPRDGDAQQAADGIKKGTTRSGAKAST